METNNSVEIALIKDLAKLDDGALWIDVRKELMLQILARMDYAEAQLDGMERSLGESIKQNAALASENERLEAKARKAWEVADWHLSHRTKAEGERDALQAVIKAAQEQEPVAFVDKDDDSQWAEILPDVSVDVGQMLYANPVPAQSPIITKEDAVYFHKVGDDLWAEVPREEMMRYGTIYHRVLYRRPVPSQSPAARGTNEYGLDAGYMSEKLNLFLRDIDRHTKQEAARVLARLAMVADESVLHEPEFQSPAAAVPDSPAVEKAWSRFQSAIESDHSLIETEDSREQFYLWADEKGFCMDEIWSSVGEPFESEDTQLAWEIWQASRSFIAAPSPHITEQDAREIQKTIKDIVQDYECGDEVDRKLSTLLNKLNTKPERENHG